MASFSGTFEFDQHDGIPLILHFPAETFQAGFAIGSAHVEDEDGEPCITDVVLGIGPNVRRFSWRMANEADRHTFACMATALRASERFCDWLSDAYAFERPCRRAA